jgi:epoxyqueuosine reductase QueG
VLGLLALLLGFNFVMAETRYESRRLLVIDEANAIGTSALRARLLPEPLGGEVYALLKRYVSARLDYDYAREEAAVARALAESTRLQGEIWSRATAAANQDPHAITRGLLLQSLNEMIDLDTRRVEEMRAHVPTAVLASLFLAAMAGLGWLGLGMGLGGHRHLVTMLTLALLIAVIVALILDVDQARRGLVEVSHHALIELQRRL